LIVALLLAAVVSAAAVSVDVPDFDAELALEAPELAEPHADAFMTLADIGADGAPELSFAELAEHAQDEHEAEADTETDADTDDESESAVDTEADTEAEGETEVAEPALLEESVERKELKPWHRSNRNQPVARNNAEITCLDGDCTRAVGVRKAAVGTHPNANTKPPPTKLDIALGAVKEEIMVRAKELHLEKNWSGKVAKLIDEYQQKLNKVSGNIVAMRAQVKALLRKKKQIQNVQVQKKLRYKLQLAQADLNRLQKQMEHIAGKENEFTDTEKQLKSTMNALKNSLLKLRGQEPQKLVEEGIELP